jgi:hypothetical protein
VPEETDARAPANNDNVSHHAVQVGRAGRHFGSGSDVSSPRDGTLVRRFSAIHNQQVLMPVTVTARLTPQTGAWRSRSALLITETELRLIASAAIIGFRSQPENG